MKQEPQRLEGEIKEALKKNRRADACCEKKAAGEFVLPALRYTQDYMHAKYQIGKIQQAGEVLSVFMHCKTLTNSSPAEADFSALFLFGFGAKWIEKQHFSLHRILGSICTGL